MTKSIMVTFDLVSKKLVCNLALAKRDERTETVLKKSPKLDRVQKWMAPKNKNLAHTCPRRLIF